MTGSDGSPLRPADGGLLNRRPADVMVCTVERQGLISPRLFVAATFVAGCVLAVGVLGTAV
jgi:hypothetical protein